MTQKEMKVGKIGWDEANENIPLVLLDAKTRRELGVENGMLVRVSKVGSTTKVYALVNKLFWEFVGTGKTVINERVKTDISVNVDDNVLIEHDLTPEQMHDIQMQLVANTIQGQIMRQLERVHQYDNEPTKEDD